MAEIYTGDFIGIAQKYADKIVERVGERKDYYAIEDECCNLKQKLCKLIYERLSIEFHKIIEDSKNPDFDLDKELFKTINEL